MAWKKKIIAIGLAIVTVCQLVPGLWIASISAREGGKAKPPNRLNRSFRAPVHSVLIALV